MPDYPESVVQAVAEVMLRQYDSQYNADHLTWRDFADPAREVLDAAAPLLATACAQAITGHMESHGPQDGDRRGALTRNRYRRCMRTAAQVATFAFTTEDEKKRMAAEALAAGNYVACRSPETGD